MITPAVFLKVMNHVLKTASRADYFSGLKAAFPTNQSGGALRKRPIAFSGSAFSGYFVAAECWP